MWASTRGLIATGALAILLAATTAFTLASDPDAEVPPTVADGPALFHTKGCIGCHTTLTSSGGSIGPNLAGLTQRAATRIEGMTAPDYIRQSIKKPSAFTVPGYQAGIMPVLSLADTEIDILVEYLLEDRPSTGISSTLAEEPAVPPEAHHEPASECPVTTPQIGFDPPSPYPADYPNEDLIWYGTEDLWTALSINGDHAPRKSVWWSVAFPGGLEEEQPEVWVTWRRLDAEEPDEIDNQGRATNAYTDEEGWFMIAGIDPDESGCWEVEASYKAATLSYVYQHP